MSDDSRRLAGVLPVTFFLSVLSPNASEPNALIYFACLGAVIPASGVLTLGVGLLRNRAPVDAKTGGN